MGALPVVVLGVGPERTVEMAPTQDQRPVETLGPDGLDDPFSVGVRVGSPDRGADDPDPLRAQHRVERAAELRVPVPDEKRKAGDRPSSRSARLRACWVTHAESGCTVDGLTWIRRLPSSMNTRTSSVRSQAVSTVKKSHAMMPSAWARRNSVHVGPDRLGAGPARAVRSRVRTVVALTRCPSLRSSPPIRTQLQRGFSRARRRMSARTWDRSAAGPGGPSYGRSTSCVRARDANGAGSPG